MTKRYRILFQGVLQDEEAFKARMRGLGTPSDVVDGLLGRAPVVVKSDLTLGDARRWAEQIQQAGGRVTIQEDGLQEDRSRCRHLFSFAGLSAFTVCPVCGLKQLRRAGCERCGTRLEPVPLRKAGPAA
jgi:hypothetical protein